MKIKDEYLKSYIHTCTQTTPECSPEGDKPWEAETSQATVHSHTCSSLNTDANFQDIMSTALKLLHMSKFLCVQHRMSTKTPTLLQLPVISTVVCVQHKYLCLICHFKCDSVCVGRTGNSLKLSDRMQAAGSKMRIRGPPGMRRSFLIPGAMTPQTKQQFLEGCASFCSDGQQAHVRMKPETGCG